MTKTGYKRYQFRVYCRWCSDRFGVPIEEFCADHSGHSGYICPLHTGLRFYSAGGEGEVEYMGLVGYWMQYVHVSDWYIWILAGVQ